MQKELPKNSQEHKAPRFKTSQEPEEEPIEEKPLEEPKEEELLEESEEETYLYLMSDARSKPGPAESGDSCESKLEIDRIIQGCILELEDSLFTIDLILFKHGSFDVVEGMDWLSKHRAKIVYHEKVVRITLAKGEVLQVHGERT
ncbi:putative reverse transcriptase domain-containing protein [Tanacetum coccineum]